MFIWRAEGCVYRSDNELEGRHAQRIFVPIFFETCKGVYYCGMDNGGFLLHLAISQQ
jgi:hypothetical protein